MTCLLKEGGAGWVGVGAIQGAGRCLTTLTAGATYRVTVENNRLFVRAGNTAGLRTHNKLVCCRKRLQ